MKQYRVRIVADLLVEFDGDQATEKSAAHVAVNNWTYPGREIDKVDRKLGRVRAIQQGPAEVQGVLKPWTKGGR